MIGIRSLIQNEEIVMLFGFLTETGIGRVVLFFCCIFFILWVVIPFFKKIQRGECLFFHDWTPIEGGTIEIFPELPIAADLHICGKCKKLDSCSPSHHHCSKCGRHLGY